jgi:hypothetical protein
MEASSLLWPEDDSTGRFGFPALCTAECRALHVG